MSQSPLVEILFCLASFGSGQTYLFQKKYTSVRGVIWIQMGMETLSGCRRDLGLWSQVCFDFRTNIFAI